jgi:AcrR family transcriptional regulator
MSDDKSYHHENLRDRLLDEAIAIARESGAHALSLREVARRAGVSHMAPYRHFKDKEALLAAIAERGFDRLSKKMSSVAKPGLSFPEVFENMGHAYVQFVLDSPDTARIMFGGFITDMDEHKTCHDAGMSAFGQLLHLIRTGQELGYFDKKYDVEALGAMIWSQVHGFAMLLAENQFDMISIAARDRFREQINSMVTGVFLKGLKP